MEKVMTKKLVSWCHGNDPAISDKIPGVDGSINSIQRKEHITENE